jgi:hypothetical protein
MPSGNRARGPQWAWLSLLAGGIAAVVLVVGIGPQGVLLQRASACELGPAVGTYTIWTPTAIVNIPDGGSVGYNVSYSYVGDRSLSSWNYTFTSGSLTVGSIPAGPIASGGGPGESAPSAGIFATYADFNWTFYRTENVSQAGGVSNPCTQPYVGEMSWPAAGCESLWSVIPLANNSTDVNEPHVWNGTTGEDTSYQPGCPYGTAGTSVWFDSSFHVAGTGAAAPVQWNLCNSQAPQELEVTGLAQVPVQVTVPLGNGSITATGLLRWISQPPQGVVEPTVTYNVPGGWMWTLAPVGPVSSGLSVPSSEVPSPSGLVAFIRTAC